MILQPNNSYGIYKTPYSVTEEDIKNVKYIVSIQDEEIYRVSDYRIEGQENATTSLRILVFETESSEEITFHTRMSLGNNVKYYSSYDESGNLLYNDARTMLNELEEIREYNEKKLEESKQKLEEAEVDIYNFNRLLGNVKSNIPELFI